MINEQRVRRTEMEVHVRVRVFKRVLCVCKKFIGYDNMMLHTHFRQHFDSVSIDSKMVYAKCSFNLKQKEKKKQRIRIKGG